MDNTNGFAQQLAVVVHIQLAFNSLNEGFNGSGAQRQAGGDFSAAKTAAEQPQITNTNRPVNNTRCKAGAPHTPKPQ
jgi:hypothetical protein